MEERQTPGTRAWRSAGPLRIPSLGTQSGRKDSHGAERIVPRKLKVIATGPKDSKKVTCECRNCVRVTRKESCALDSNATGSEIVKEVNKIVKRTTQITTC